MNSDGKTVRFIKLDNYGENIAFTSYIKEKVKNAGGNVNGVLRCSLSWFNYDDLDIHVKEPGGNHIYYGYIKPD